MVIWGSKPCCDGGVAALPFGLPGQYGSNHPDHGSCCPIAAESFVGRVLETEGSTLTNIINFPLGKIPCSFYCCYWSPCLCWEGVLKCPSPLPGSSLLFSQVWTWEIQQECLSPKSKKWCCNPFLKISKATDSRYVVLYSILHCTVTYTVLSIYVYISVSTYRNLSSAWLL